MLAKAGGDQLTLNARYAAAPAHGALIINTGMRRLHCHDYVIGHKHSSPHNLWPTYVQNLT